MPKTPLRGALAPRWMIAQVMPALPLNFEEYREPFATTALFYFPLRQMAPQVRFWLNSPSEEIYAFWKMVQQKPYELKERVLDLKTQYRKRNEELFQYVWNQMPQQTEEDKAVRYYILNRISYSGLAETGIFSQDAARKRFFIGRGRTLLTASIALQGTLLTQFPYEQVIHTPGENVLICVHAPPQRNYPETWKGFPLEGIAEELKRCPHRWLVVQENGSTLQELFPESFVLKRHVGVKKKRVGWVEIVVVSNFPLINLSKRRKRQTEDAT
jgi:DNA adenine methylase